MVSQKTANCRQVEANLIGYLKEGLPPGQQAAVRAHLLQCGACSQLLQEARELDAALFIAAPRSVQSLPPELSARIQADLYRRLRRALWWQRTRDAAGQGLKLAATATVLLLLAFWFVPWLRYVATAGSAPPTAEPLAAAIGSPQATATPRPTLMPHPTAVPSPAPPDRLFSALVVAHQTPAERVEELFLLAGNRSLTEGELLRLPRPAVERVWGRVGNCAEQFDTTQLTYETLYHQSRFVTVRVFWQQEYIGDLKLWLGDDGNWYPTFLNYASFSALDDHCRRR